MNDAPRPPGDGTLPAESPPSAEVLRRAARRPDAPPRLLRAADAVLEGKFSWEEVASGQCTHPSALALFTPRAHETLWPLLREVADEVDPDNALPEEPIHSREITDDDDYYAQFSVMRKPSQPRNKHN